MLSWDQCRKLQVGYNNTLHGRAWFNHHLHRSLLAPCMGSSARCLRVDMGVQPWSMGIKSNRWEDVSLSDCLPSCQPLPNHPKISLEMIPWVRTIEAKSPGDVHRGWNTRIQSSGDHCGETLKTSERQCQREHIIVHLHSWAKNVQHGKVNHLTGPLPIKSVND